MHDHTARAHDEDDDDDDDVIWEACRARRRCFPAEFLLRGFLGFPKDHPAIFTPQTRASIQRGSGPREHA